MKHGLQVIKLKKWNDYHELVLKSFQNPNYVYRGQKDPEWSLEPALHRLLKQKGVTQKDYDKVKEKHLDTFIKSIRGRTHIYERISDDASELWALGQHFGLKTPFLDFTLSPYVAAYFALNQESKNDHCVVYAVSKKFIGDAGSLDIYEPRTDHNQRLLNQSGLFVVFNTLEDMSSILTKTVVENTSKVKIRKILVPMADRNAAMKHLESMNISSNTLFPDLQGACEYCNHTLSQNYT